MTRRLAALQCVCLLCLLLLACNEPVPLGPDLVACSCQCTTKWTTAEGGQKCSGLCDPPCEFNEFCNIRGACSPFCDPNALPSSQTTVRNQTLHVCVDATDPSLATRACVRRCDGFADGSALQCLNGLLVAIGILDAGGDTIPFNLPDKINPNAAQSLTDLLVEECGTWLLDTVLLNCGYHTKGPEALLDLVLCFWSPVTMSEKGFLTTRTCNSVPSPGGEPFEVVRVNGCPEFLRPGGGAEPETPVGGFRLSATAEVVPGSSSVSIAGPDVSPASSPASGNASALRLGPILLITSLNGNLPNGKLTVKGREVTLSDGFLELKKPAAAVLTEGGAFEIPPGKLQFIATGSVSGKVLSVEGANAAGVTGHYDEATGRFDLAASFDVRGLAATVRLALVLNFTNRPPLANAGPDQTIECTLPSREGIVRLSADQSVEKDAGDRIANYAWTVDSFAVGQGATASQVSTPLGLGTRLAAVATTDTRGSTSLDVALITVVDTQPPVFDRVTVDPDCLWPPNHKMVLLRLGHEIIAEAHDACGGLPKPVPFIKSVTSSQPDGSDVVHGTGAACLRAERDATTETPRTYKITLAAVDALGHEVTRVVEVTVPHDGGGQKCPAVAKALFVEDGDPACVASVPPVPAAATISLGF